MSGKSNQAQLMEDGNEQKLVANGNELKNPTWHS